MSKYSYLLIKRLEVNNVNALTHYLVTNGPSVSAAVGVAHAICRLSQYGVEDFRGVALIHHDASLQADYDQYGKALPIQRRGASFINSADYASTIKNGTNISLSLQPSVTRHETISLVLRLDNEHDLDERQIISFLRGGRFAGGHIQRYSGVSFHDSLTDVKTHLGSGFAVMDKSDLIAGSGFNTDHALLDYLHIYSEQITAAAIDAVKQSHFHWIEVQADTDINANLTNDIAKTFSEALDFLDAMQLSYDHDDWKPQPPLKYLSQLKKKLCNKLFKAGTLSEKFEPCLVPIEECIATFNWLSATSLGYALINEPTQRTNARAGYNHAFAEPLLGLVQYRSIRQTVDAELPFWQGHWRDNHTFILTTQVEHE
ncbi:type I-F CRISPR-associated protein Csy2 [Photobacterium lutimaris]|uniref:Type I-F CRISPR-associated protein Csy2 n=1 Tax=Photobacterium lutimaris TaxID=388278 RepID=A0A2T3J4Q7_9GAMM|nr:type I-F CRISPR-associated protein Csy2 [Photobacterium lutimaris]PSU36280.1 hypothetical protein C9I99_04585 [Photobacterium lutimaris]TDR74837.1 CRISPR type I-F-associated protein Csy2 [Photobacterium lutimaris]